VHSATEYQRQKNQIIDRESLFAMSLANNAAWIHGKGQKIKVGPADIGKPGKGEVLVKNHALAINPIDWKMEDLGFLVRSWPAVLGGDLAGEVIKVGEGFVNIKKGQRVLAHPLSLMTGKVENTGFQNYTVVMALGSSLIPDDMKFEEAAVLPLSMSTASTGLFQDDFFNLPLPSTTPRKSSKVLLVWVAAQVWGAKSFNLPLLPENDVIATASKKNFDYYKKLGAKEVFDYNNPNIVADFDLCIAKCRGCWSL
jgi:NADPH:quinone reductase-like Zn-dependent oxidoreductase